MKRSGVYLIRNLVSQKIYVGSSININKHWSRHRYNLRRGLHCNNIIQKDWNKCTESNFDFSIQELCLKQDLLTRETYWVNFYNSMNPEKGYNCVLPNDLKIHRSTALTRVLKDIICININTKEIRELTILQIKESINISSRYVYKAIRYWIGKPEGKRSVKGWIFIRKEDFNPSFDYIGYDKFKEYLNKTKV